MTEAEWRKQYEENQRKDEAEEETQRAAARAAAAKVAAARQPARQPVATLPPPPTDVQEAQQPIRRQKAEPLEEPEDRAGSQKLPPLPALPADLADWQLGDFHVARSAGDRRLPEAIRALSKKGWAEAGVVELFRDLLQPCTTTGWGNASGDESRGSGRKSSAMLLIEAVADALAETDTPPARVLLGQMITGKAISDDDKTAALAAVRTLVEHPCRENNEMLLRVLIDPTKVRPAGRGPITAEELQKQTLIMLKPAATPEMRLRIAEHLIGVDMPAADRMPLVSLVCEPRPENLEAQVHLYRSGRVDQQTRASLQQQICRNSSQALAAVLGLAGSDPASDRSWPARVIRHAWDPRVTSAIRMRLEAIPSLAEGAGLVALASTVPSDTFRSAIVAALSRNWEDGPDPLRGAGIAGATVSEPGLLTALKAVHRREAGSMRNQVATKTSPSAAKSARLVAARQRRSDPQQTDWTKLIEDLIRSQCERFHATSCARLESAGRAGQRIPVNDLPRGLPLTLDAADCVVAAYSFDRESAVKGDFPELPKDPLIVYYLRIEEKARPVTIYGFYRRQLKLCESRPLEHGVWLDSLSAGSSPGRKRSLDVLITAANPQASRLAEDEQKLVIEILSVEIRNPARIDDNFTSAR
jgi:hypothetical protein